MLGRNDPRELSQHPDHAIRVLADLASYVPGKPVLYNQKVLAAAQAWLSDPGLPSYRYLPLDVVTPLLAKQAEYHRTEGHSFRFGYVGINLPVVESLRKDAVRYVEKCLGHPHPRVAARALRTLREIVNHPASLVGHMVSPEEMEAWKPEQLEGVRLLNEFLFRTENPVLQAYAMHELGWHAENGHPTEVARGVAEALKLVPPSLELDLVIALTVALYDIGRAYADSAAAQQDFLRDLAEKFLEKYVGDEGILKLELAVNEIETAGVPFSQSQLFWELGRKNTDEARLILDHILAHEGCHLTGYAVAVIVALRLNDPESSLGFAQRMVADGRGELMQAVAASYANAEWVKHPRDTDFVLLRKLLDGDDSCKFYAFEGLRRLKDAGPPDQAQILQRLGIRLLTATDIGQRPRMAESLTEAIDFQFGIPPELLADNDIDKILQKLVPVSEITHREFHLTRFLGFVVKRSPERVVKFFLDRIQYSIAHKDANLQYTPTPFGLDGLFGEIADTPAHFQIIRQLAEALKEQDALKRYWFTKLFGLVAGSFGPATQRAISELAADRDERNYKVIATLLQEVPRDFIFSEKDLCADLLESARGISDQAFEMVSGALLGSSQSGGFSGIPGQPSPQQLSIRDRATQLATEYVSRPAVAAFYRQVAQFAQQMIDDQLARDEEDFVE